MNFIIKTFDQLTTTELYAILKERTQVFVVEQNCSYLEVDGKDLKSYHLYKEQNGEVIAYLRISPPGVSYTELSIGRVLVKKENRGQKLAQQMMTYALQFIHNELHETTVKIQAQEYLRDFYGSFGFEAISDVYLDDNIPHIDMLLKK
ncbi:GNAT family N-acetyltransferase [Lysinibacillus sp. 2017]|uniref:GNAT family N-acetyltransferase n=1 Tax=unclassified Lysinibacillus TaxID=2636778 RepID=UPI000D529C3A|nr:MULTISPECIES: GNAT family N-acetyltransferase [unclassified Lysinibacillus]AWE07631.1 GNAT family N-acetyltransferase [Lysinibacillus sp. 2017]TGN36794.1 GNAT family N-acetyltransferase [Lysinibacillus sp. S2017]